MNIKNYRPGPFLSLWLLIALALALFVGLSFSDVWKIGSYEMTRPSFKEILTAHEEEPDTSVNQIIAEIEPQSEETIVEPDTTVHKMLIFGDSMTHNLAMALARYGTRNNFKVTSVTWESSSILSWSKSDKLSRYLNEVKPDFVIISLGSNELDLKNFDARAPSVKKIIEKLDTLPYIWVAPPLWKKDKGLYSMIEKNIDPSRFFATGQLEMERGPDHVHPTRRGARVWADSIMQWQVRSPHPILSEAPDSATNTKGHKFIYLHPDD